MKNKISAVLITLNEEQNIERTLNALTWCDEIVVVDSHSTDRTVEICEKYNCKVILRKFNGYGDQKRFAIDNASNDWVLNIDADEVLSDELISSIKNEIDRDNIEYAGFSVRRILVFMNKKFNYGKESNDYQLRLFKRENGNFSENIVHETVKLDGKIKKIKEPMFHYSYASVEDYFDRFNKYTSKAADELYSKGKSRSKLSIGLSFPFYFINNYFIKLNFMNGFPGFVWAFFSSVYPIAKYTKVIERNGQAKS